MQTEAGENVFISRHPSRTNARLAGADRQSRRLFLSRWVLGNLGIRLSRVRRPLPIARGLSVGRRRRALSWRVFFPSRLQDYYSGGYYPAQDPALVPPQEIAPDASFIDDEAVS